VSSAIDERQKAIISLQRSAAVQGAHPILELIESTTLRGEGCGASDTKKRIAKKKRTRQTSMGDRRVSASRRSQTPHDWRLTRRETESRRVLKMLMRFISA
jgi:hypothetical protein